MNPLHPFPSDDQLYSQISSANYTLPIQTAAPEDQILLDPMMDGGVVPPRTNQRGKGKQRKQLPTSGAEDYNQMDNENKKWMHREIEKQRRQEMSRLCTTFRSLLPIEYLKGKRSTSDHMHEGVNYIKYLQNKVQQLQAKRDELMKLSSLSRVVPESGSFNTHDLPTYVTVEPFSGGIQIKCSYSFRNYALPLSRVLDIVLKEGLNLVNCTSIKTDDRFIHTIRSEDPQMRTETDYTELQRKIAEAISSSSNIVLFAGGGRL